MLKCNGTRFNAIYYTSFSANDAIPAHSTLDPQRWQTMDLQFFPSSEIRSERSVACLDCWLTSITNSDGKPMQSPPTCTKKQSNYCKEHGLPSIGSQWEKTSHRRACTDLSVMKLYILLSMHLGLFFTTDVLNCAQQQSRGKVNKKNNHFMHSCKHIIYQLTKLHLTLHIHNKMCGNQE